MINARGGGTDGASQTGRRGRAIGPASRPARKRGAGDGIALTDAATPEAIAVRVASSRPEARLDLASGLSVAVALQMLGCCARVVFCGCKVEDVRVLIAEDDEAVRYLMRVNIELAGHEIVGEAESGRDALDQLRKEHPDVLVLDMMMPGMNGRDVLVELSNVPQSGTMVIAFSAAPTELEHARELGADAAVLKTGDLDELIDALAML